MTELNITETEVPTGTAAAKAPNPYAAHIKRLADNRRTDENDGKALTFEVPRDKGTNYEDYEKAVAKMVAKWQEGGAEHGVTIRAKIERTGPDKKVTGKVTVWAIDRITREKKSESDASSAS